MLRPKLQHRHYGRSGWCTPLLSIDPYPLGPIFFYSYNVKRSTFEIVAVLLTGISKFLFVDLINAKFWFIIITGVFWCGYLILRIRQNRNILDEWGFRSGGFWPSVKIVYIPAIALTLLSIGLGLNKDHLILNWHILPIMILYPVWGTLQQFLIISLFGGNFNKMKSSKIHHFVIVILTAALFAIVHYPSIQLIIATFFLAVFYMILFIRHKNLWALGLFHGWMACIFYFFALGRDPWIEFIETI